MTKMSDAILGRNARPLPGDVFYVVNYYDRQMKKHTFGSVHKSKEDARLTMNSVRNNVSFIPQFIVKVTWKGDCNAGL